MAIFVTNGVPYVRDKIRVLGRTQLKTLVFLSLTFRLDLEILSNYAYGRTEISFERCGLDSG